MLVRRGICPDCGKRSRRHHGWRYRRLQDYPAHGEAVTTELRIGRWRCTFQGCDRSTFSDQASDVAAPHARRTLRTAQMASHLGHATGGKAGERLMRRFGIPISDDTILRQLKRDIAIRIQPPRVIGIDDWSWRKTWRYGTIVVDLERRSVVDILEDRSVESAASWLRRNPSVEVVSRDRCGLYAQAVREGVPQALQIADRFHLVQNLRLAIEEQMSLSGRSTGRAILSEEDTSMPRSIVVARAWHFGNLAKRFSRRSTRCEMKVSPTARSSVVPDTSVAAWRNGSHSRRRRTGVERH